MTFPTSPLLELSTLWIQVTGTWCNLTCTHCLNSSGPHNPWLKSLETEMVIRYIKEGAELGIKEIYYTGGEPFLHRDMLLLTAHALGRLSRMPPVLGSGHSFLDPHRRC